MKKLRIGSLFSLLVVLSACGGGGGGDGGAPPSPLSFNLRNALQAASASGQNATFSVVSSNECSGTGTYNAAVPIAGAQFEGQPALSSVTVLTITYTDCTPPFFSSTVTGYSDANYTPLGASGEAYLVYTQPITVPTTVKVGDVGIIGNAIRYSDSSKSLQTGLGQLSYIIEADTESTAIFSIITKFYDSGNSLEATQLTRYRINSDNSVRLLSLLIQSAAGDSVTLTRTN
jgi:hypothetical protein